MVMEGGYPWAALRWPTAMFCQPCGLEMFWGCRPRNRCGLEISRPTGGRNKGDPIHGLKSVATIVRPAGRKTVTCINDRYGIHVKPVTMRNYFSMRLPGPQSPICNLHFPAVSWWCHLVLRSLAAAVSF